MIGSFRLPILAGGITPTEGWQRPSDWLEIDSLVNDGDEKFVGLHLITEDSNFLALSATGAYTVDWGDGIVENYNSGVIAYHIFDWNDFVGTDTSIGYRQAIVTVTPQVAGTFTNINLERKHNQSGLQAYSLGWLDIVISAPNMTSINISSPTIISSNLEQFTFKGSNLITNMSQMFYNCYSLKSVPLFDTSSATNMSFMFRFCYSLQSVPLFDTSIVADMSYMFRDCYSLRSVPLFNTTSATNMFQMFYLCNTLQSVPLFDTSGVINITQMFFSCPSLQKASLSGTNISIDYSNCKLSADALADIFTNLATVTGGQTITITNNWGASLLSAAQRQIATNKGWTIIG